MDLKIEKKYSTKLWNQNCFKETNTFPDDKKTFRIMQIRLLIFQLG